MLFERIGIDDRLLLARLVTRNGGEQVWLEREER